MRGGDVGFEQADFSVTPIGRVESSLTDPAEAPKQGHEGGPDAWLVFDAGVAEGLEESSQAPA